MTEPLDLVALEKIRKEAVAMAAFWVSFADAAKSIGDMARAEAVALVGSHRVPSATAEDAHGRPLGKLSHTPDKWEWVVADGVALLDYFQRTYPEWVETVPEYVVPAEVVPAKIKPDTYKLADWLTSLTPEGIDPGTGFDVSDLVQKSTTPGKWTLTKDKNAKQRVRDSLAAMLEEQGLAIPAEARRMIEGGR